MDTLEVYYKQAKSLKTDAFRKVHTPSYQRYSRHTHLIITSPWIVRPVVTIASRFSSYYLKSLGFPLSHEMVETILCKLGFKSCVFTVIIDTIDEPLTYLLFQVQVLCKLCQLLIEKRSEMTLRCFPAFSTKADCPESYCTEKTNGRKLPCLRL